MQDLRALFESEYPGKERLFGSLIKPIFSKAKDTSLTDKQVLADSDRKQIKSFSIIAQVRGGFPIVFADVELQDTVDLKRSRVAIQNCVRKVMQDYSNAIIFFHFTDNAKEWRVSYVYRAGTNKSSTSAKRYTYLCGPEHVCRTVSERFETLKGLPLIKNEDMVEAFSVEPLSKEFFDEYKTFYEDFVQYITGNRYVKVGGKYEKKTVGKENKAIFSQFKEIAGGDYDRACKLVRDYVKKLMGRLVFLHFLQKKGWLGVSEGKPWGSGDRNFIQNLFANACDGVKDDFLSRALEPLFFRTLNTDRGNAALAPDEISAVYGRNVRIPYLNGGLFEEDELDRMRARFKKERFSDLLDFFSRYNFTIDESDPTDKEIGIDPEMLGKIFENLLEDNKDKGAFYTPKEIVQYMCRESLAAYLCADGGADAGKVRRIMERGDSEGMGDGEKSALLGRLRAVKVCDPAVGSGAFPMGMMNELLALRSAFGDTEETSEIKKQIVRDNIYGVDIEKGAVDIARLRFWLAIIVDEKEPIPLPNLDYKIMRGNSLLESYTYKIRSGDNDKEITVDLSRMLAKPDDGSLDYNEEPRNLLKTNIDGYFDPGSHEHKRTKNDVIKACVFDLACSTCGLKQNSPAALALHEKIWNGTDEFFLWHTWFGDVFNGKEGQGGFDIVIGNPPYISAPTQIANKRLAEQRERLAMSKRYKSLYQKWDLFVPFIELGTQLNSHGGITAMIVPFPLTNQLYAKEMRRLLVEEADLFELVDLNGTKIFENATVSNCIPFIRKSVANGKTWISNINEKLEIRRVFEQRHADLVQDGRTFVWNVTQEKREANRHADMNVLGDYCYVSKGMVLHSEEKEFTNEDLISNTKDNVHCRKYLEAKDMDRYVINRIRFIEYDTDRVPAKVSRPTFRELYDNSKLLFNCLGELKVMLDFQDDYICQQSIRVAVRWVDLKCVENKSIATSIKKFSTMKREEMEAVSKNVDLRYLLGILNSRYASVLLTNIRGGDYHIVPEHIRNIPIPPATATQQKPVIALVDKILAAKKQDPSADTSALEAQIDDLVYALYGLTAEEIAVVEGR